MEAIRARKEHPVLQTSRRLISLVTRIVVST